MSPGRRHPPRVCVVGAGVSGLCSCRHLMSQGLDPVVLEARQCVGGVWSSLVVSITKVQSPSSAYQFSDFPWPEGTAEHPTADEVLAYLESYAKHYRLLEKIRFNSKVLRISKQDGENLGVWNEDERPWEVLVQTGEKTERLVFDFVLLCIGRFGDVPKIPVFAEGMGPEVYKGTSLHSLEYSALSEKERRELMANKKVVVVGFCKSAIDLATEAAMANEGSSQEQTCTLLFRTPQWILKNWFVFGVHLGYLYGTRFTEMLVPKPEQGYLSSALSRMLFPLRWAISKLCEAYVGYSLPIAKFGLVPPHSFEAGLSSCKIAIVPDTFFPYLEQARIKLCKSSSWNYYENGVVVDGGEKVEADVVILATGFQGEVKLQSVLTKEYADVLRGPGGVVPLYRGVVHPRIPNLAFVGYQEDLSNMRSSELAARWISHLLIGKFKLPETAAMEKNTDAWLKYMKIYSAYYERACVGVIKTWHCDELCRDMGWNPNRKKGWFQELFSPYSNMDYNEPN